MRSSRWLLCAFVTTTVACTGPERDAFPEDPATAGSTSSTASTSASSPTSSGSTASTASSNDGGGGSGASGGNGPSGPGGSDGGSAPAGPGAGGDGPGPGVGGSGGGVGGSGGETTGGGGGSGPIPTCDGGVCLPTVPGGWTGPLALFEVAPEASLPSCNLTGWPTTLGDYFGDLDEGTALCDCDCSAAQGVTCSGNGSYCGRGNVAQCQTVCTATEITPGACVSAVSPNFLQVFEPAPSSVGTCNATPTVDLPTAEWGVKARACQGATTTPDGCNAGEVCAPAPVNGEMCVVVAGDVACPGGGWTEKHLRHTSFTDTRACSACSCGSATSTCGGVMYFTDPGTTNCGSQSFLVDVVSAGSCSSLDDASYMQYGFSPSGTCPPVGGALSGGVTLDGTATYCCVE